MISPFAPKALWLQTSGAFFLHFLSLGFAVFPLQTHLRQVHPVATASIIASVIPVAGLLTLLFFRFAERRQWTQYPTRLLLLAAICVAILQPTLGWQLSMTRAQANLLPAFLETSLCLLALASAHACCMNLLNHLAVANLANHAYSARAAGSAGYAVAILATAALLSDEQSVIDYHLFLAASCAVAHSLFIASSLLIANRHRSADSSLKATKMSQSHPTAPTTPPGQASNPGAPDQSSPDQSSPGQSSPGQSSPGQSSPGQSSPGPRDPGPSPQSDSWRWRALILLVALTAFCEAAFGLYSHEFLTKTYGDTGYYLFALTIFLETALLLGLPFLPNIRRRLLFVGPLGWLVLLTGCLLAQAGWPIFGALAIAMALNCPFQVACNENAHAIRPQISGLATIALAQALGVFCSQWTSALLNRFILPKTSLQAWTILWISTLGVALGGLLLALMIQPLRSSNRTD
jgi:hypothetical protein